MIKKKTLWAKIILAVLTLCGIWSVYWALFAVWMTAIPHRDPRVWVPRAYALITVSVLIGFCWIALLVWLILQWRKRKMEEKKKKAEGEKRTA